jgi:hypothetical protein
MSAQAACVPGKLTGQSENSVCKVNNINCIQDEYSFLFFSPTRIPWAQCPESGGFYIRFARILPERAANVSMRQNKRPFAKKIAEKPEKSGF